MVKDIELPVLFKNQLILKEGIWNGLNIQAEELKKSVLNTEWNSKSRALIYSHSAEAENWVGSILNERYSNGAFYADLEIWDADLAIKLKHGKAPLGVSSRFGYNEVIPNDHTPIDMFHENISIVYDPGCDPAMINFAKDKKKDGKLHAQVMCNKEILTKDLSSDGDLRFKSKKANYEYTADGGHIHDEENPEGLHSHPEIEEMVAEIRNMIMGSVGEFNSGIVTNESSRGSGIDANTNQEIERKKKDKELSAELKKKSKFMSNERGSCSKNTMESKENANDNDEESEEESKESELSALMKTVESLSARIAELEKEDSKDEAEESNESEDESKESEEKSEESKEESEESEESGESKESEEKSEESKESTESTETSGATEELSKAAKELTSAAKAMKKAVPKTVAEFGLDQAKSQEATTDRLVKELGF